MNKQQATRYKEIDMKTDQVPTTYYQLPTTPTLGHLTQIDKKQWCPRVPPQAKLRHRLGTSNSRDGERGSIGHPALAPMWY